MNGDEVRRAGREIKVPRARHKSGGHDPAHTFINICGRLVVMGYYQVAAQTTPSPLSCPLIALNSNSMNWEMYRTKGRISRTPFWTVAITVRTFMTVFEIDCTFCVVAINNHVRGRRGRTNL